MTISLLLIPSEKLNIIVASSIGSLVAVSANLQENPIKGFES
jgi:hypothetical protein